jgi:hypothetical protein
LILQDPWTDPVSFAIRSSVIAQGIATSSAGRGELSAAYDAATDMVGSVMPMVWGSLFQFFSNAVATQSKSHVAGIGGAGRALAALGIGGHFALAALARVLAGVVVWMIPADQLAAGSGSGSGSGSSSSNSSSSISAE